MTQLKDKKPIPDCIFCDNYDQIGHNSARCKTCDNGKWLGFGTELKKRDDLYHAAMLANQIRKENLIAEDKVFKITGNMDPKTKADLKKHLMEKLPEIERRTEEAFNNYVSHGIGYYTDKIVAQGDSQYNDGSAVVHTNLATGEKTVFSSDEFTAAGNLGESVEKMRKYMELSRFRKWLLKLKRRWRVRHY